MSDETRKEFNIWFDSKYYTIDPIARETAYRSWLAGREAEKEAMLKTGTLFGETGWVEEVGSFLGSKPGYCRHDQRDLNDFLAANRMQLTEDSCTLTVHESTKVINQVVETKDLES